VRLSTVSVLWLFIAVSSVLLRFEPWIVGLLLLVAGGVTVHLYTLPTTPASVPSD
jgi:hypothetical protein